MHKVVKKLFLPLLGRKGKSLGVLDATRPASACAQRGIETRWYRAHKGREDCLTLNVYVPEYEGKTVRSSDEVPAAIRKSVLFSTRCNFP